MPALYPAGEAEVKRTGGGYDIIQMQRKKVKWVREIRVGIVGTGKMGQAHLEALRRIPEVRVIAVASRSGQSARGMAERFGIPEWYGDVAAMLPSVDAVHTCVNSAAHDAVNAAVLDAGKHIYAEKPLSVSLEGALSIYKKAERAGVVHALNHQYRMNPAVQEMRLRVARGELGRAFLVHGRYHQQSGLNAADFGWRMTEGASWALADIGTHWADTARCVLSRNIRSVFANVQTVHPVRFTETGEEAFMRTDDLSAVLVEFDGGAQGVVTISKVSAGHMNDLRLEIDGQNLSMRWSQENPDQLSIGYKNAADACLRVSPQTVDPSLRDLALLPGGHPLGWNDALYLSVREFYLAVRGEIAQSAMRGATFLDGVHGMAFVEAALRSAKEKRWADVETGP